MMSTCSNILVTIDYIYHMFYLQAPLVGTHPMFSQSVWQILLPSRTLERTRWYQKNWNHTQIFWVWGKFAMILFCSPLFPTSRWRWEQTGAYWLPKYTCLAEPPISNRPWVKVSKESEVFFEQRQSFKVKKICPEVLKVWNGWTWGPAGKGFGMADRGSLEMGNLYHFRPLAFLCIWLHLRMQYIWLYVYVVADYVDFIFYLWVAVTMTVVSSLRKKVLIIKFQRPWAI